MQPALAASARQTASGPERKRALLSPGAAGFSATIGRMSRATSPGAPEISVLLPVRDAAATLAAALDSTLASVGPSFELIAIDDGSRDGTAELLDTRARRDPRLRVLHRPARGIAPALGEGLAAARGRLIARMDADDETHPERLAAQAELLAARPELGLAGCQVESFPQGGMRDGFRLYTEWLNGLVEPDDVEREAFVDSPLPHPASLVPRA